MADSATDHADLLAVADDADFLRAAYERLLGRAPDPGGQAYFLDALTAGGMARADVLAAMGAAVEGEGEGAPVPGSAAAIPVDREDLDNHGLVLLMAARLGPDSTYVDVGANRGRFLEHARRLAPRGRHLAFEPLPHLAAELTTAFPDVTVHNVALSDESGRLEFVEDTTDPGYSGLKERIYPPGHELRRIEVEVARLDDLVPADITPDFVKIDVEGAEVGVLRGAVEVLRRARPHLAIEHGLGAPAYGTTSADLWDVLAGDLGYSLYDMDGGGPLDRDAFSRAVGAGDRWNWFATP